MYRIKHKPTGLYYCPAKTVKYFGNEKLACPYVKTNLSNKGKVYHTLPSLSILTDSYGSHVDFRTHGEYLGDKKYVFTDSRSEYCYNTYKSPLDEWEIECYNRQGKLIETIQFFVQEMV